MRWQRPPFPKANRRSQNLKRKESTSDMDCITYIFILFGLMSFGAVRIQAQDCDLREFQECVSQVKDFADGYTFHIKSVSELVDSCS
ncbi:hypothetical protein TNCV_186721 [Trichonephila clavipes]|nr:hypothetical protein TNCV_186721 [Trichonephila clavipes]